MTPTAILFLSSQGHAASLTSAASLAMSTNMPGFACLLLATVLIVAAMEKMHR
jgi:hypothetical protein